jgi:hypothetical protein
MEKRRGEVMTIIMIGAVVVMGVTAVISSFTQQDKKSTSSKASGCAPGKRVGTSAYYTCAANCGATDSGSCPKYSHNSKDSNCTECNVAAAPTSKPAPTSVPTKPNCNSPVGGGSCTTDCANPTNKAYFYCGGATNPTTSPKTTSIPIPTVVPISTSAPISCPKGNPYTSTSSTPVNYCVSIGGKYVSNTSTTKNGATWFCCEGGAVPTQAPAPTGSSTAAPTPGGAYPQNDTPNFEKACCFKKADGTIRVYASAQARSASQMDKPCTFAVYGNAYGAVNWFECADNTQDGSSEKEYEDAVAAAEKPAGQDPTTQSGTDSCRTISTLTGEQCSRDDTTYTTSGTTVYCCSGGAMPPANGGVTADPNAPCEGGTRGLNIDDCKYVGTSTGDYTFRKVSGVGWCCPRTEIPKLTSTPIPTSASTPKSYGTCESVSCPEDQTGGYERVKLPFGVVLYYKAGSCNSLGINGQSEEAVQKSVCKPKVMVDYPRPPVSTPIINVQQRSNTQQSITITNLCGKSVQILNTTDNTVYPVTANKPATFNISADQQARIIIKDTLTQGLSAIDVPPAVSDINNRILDICN